MVFFVDSLIRVNDIGRPPQRLGEFGTREEAFAASRRCIDEFLAREFKAGVPARLLYERFRRDAAVPFIFSEDGEDQALLAFNPLKYALLRCEELCGEAHAAS